MLVFTNETSLVKLFFLFLLLCAFAYVFLIVCDTFDVDISCTFYLGQEATAIVRQFL